MFEPVITREARGGAVDWCIRGGIALAFVIFGSEKFPSGPGEQWVKFFQDVGFGQWFRYATGVVEILGGLLVLIPRTAVAGLALLICTMASAALILIFVIHHPGDSIISIGFAVGLTLFLISRRGN
ncbi:MAG TPA: DoxX family protein [Candidatus Sulfopaludibacter sp.]|jgi:uncharacterized membrane protein YphA (DoxX/SURF4 family)|nr:DoxX family protein [Candidatus Sulfopaludibacter sp.]